MAWVRYAKRACDRSSKSTGRGLDRASWGATKRGTCSTHPVNAASGSVDWLSCRPRTLPPGSCSALVRRAAAIPLKSLTPSRQSTHQAGRVPISWRQARARPHRPEWAHRVLADEGCVSKVHIQTGNESRSLAWIWSVSRTVPRTRSSLTACREAMIMAALQAPTRESLGSVHCTDWHCTDNVGNASGIRPTTRSLKVDGSVGPESSLKADWDHSIS